MRAITSGDFLREFTLFADRASEEKETLIVQRPGGNHLVVMPMEVYNEMQKAIYLAKRAKKEEA